MNLGELIVYLWINNKFTPFQLPVPFFVKAEPCVADLHLDSAVCCLAGCLVDKSDQAENALTPHSFVTNAVAENRYDEAR